jgi:ABC-type uncharacterized transport system permease subunit
MATQVKPRSTLMDLINGFAIAYMAVWYYSIFIHRVLPALALMVIVGIALAIIL